MWCNNKLMYQRNKKCEYIIVYINVEYIKEMSSTKYKHKLAERIYNFNNSPVLSIII